MATAKRTSNHNERFKNETNQTNKGDYTAMEILQLMGEFVLVLFNFWGLVGLAFYRLFVPLRPKSVKGEIVLITGAGSGIGREMALQYSAQGATVVCLDVNEKGNLETLQEIKKMGPAKCYSYICNITDRKAVLEMAKKVEKDVGDVGILINNAGIMPSRPFLDHSADEIRNIMDVNVMAHFWTLQAFLPTMIKNNHGHIVSISSLAGMIGTRNLVPYCASKFAVRGLMESLFTELSVDKHNKIKTTTIMPYAVHTNLFDIKKSITRFPSIFRVLDARAVAKYIMNAQRRDIFETTIPRHGLTAVYICKMFPVKAVMCWNRYVDTYVAADK